MSSYSSSEPWDDDSATDSQRPFLVEEDDMEDISSYFNKRKQSQIKTTKSDKRPKLSITQDENRPVRVKVKAKKMDDAKKKKKKDQRNSVEEQRKAKEKERKAKEKEEKRLKADEKKAQALEKKRKSEESRAKREEKKRLAQEVKDKEERKKERERNAFARFLVRTPPNEVTFLTTNKDGRFDNNESDTWANMIEIKDEVQSDPEVPTIGVIKHVCSLADKFSPMRFQIKRDMTVAPIRGRDVLGEGEKTYLDDVVDGRVDVGEQDVAHFVQELKSKKFAKGLPESADMVKKKSVEVEARIKHLQFINEDPVQIPVFRGTRSWPRQPKKCRALRRCSWQKLAASDSDSGDDIWDEDSALTDYSAEHDISCSDSGDEVDTRRSDGDTVSEDLELANPGGLVDEKLQPKIDLKDEWDNLDPEVKQKLPENITHLLNELMS